MGVVAGKANQLFFFQLFVRLCFLDPFFIMTIKAKNVSNFSKQSFRLAFVDIMANDAIHDSGSVHERTVLFQVFMTFQTHILGRQYHTVYRPMAEGTVIFSFGGRMLVSRRFWR